MTDDFTPIIAAASMVPGHDGLAEVAIVVRYPNGAERSMALPHETVADALDAAGVHAMDDLVGRPWTVLTMPSPSSASPSPSSPSSHPTAH